MSCQGTILHGRVLALPTVWDHLKDACTQHLSESETTNLLSAYKLPSSSPEQQARSLNELISDLRFYIPTIAAQSGWKSAFAADRSFRYYFHAPNTVEGEFTNLASHELDVAFLLQNFWDSLDEKSRHVAIKMTDQWIRFASGEPWSEPGKIVVIGPEGVVQVDEAEYDEKFRAGAGNVLLKLGFDKCHRVAESWQGVRAEAVEKTTNGRP